MKGVWGLFILFLPFPLLAAALNPEYNIWYAQNGVLYDITQTSASQPVMVSIGQAGFATANMVVSLYAEGKCPSGEGGQSLKVNGSDIAARFSCVNIGNNRIEHYRVDDAYQVNDMFDRLRAEFTVVLQGDIKVWAANINDPKFGISPRM